MYELTEMLFINHTFLFVINDKYTFTKKSP